jgi:hypothetical protein
VISLPKPYEDELLYSVFARAIAYLAPKHDFAVRRLLGRAHCSVLFGRFLPPLVDEGIEEIWGLSLQEIVERHTMLPFYGRFLPRERLSACLDILKSGLNTSMPSKLGLQNQSNVVAPACLRFCRSCALEDISAYGETFWRRSHQLSGALVCSAHGEVLRISRAAIFQRRWGLQDATAFIDLDAAPECASLTVFERAMAKRVASRCLDFLRGIPTKWEGAEVQPQYRRSAIACGYVEGTGNLKRVSHQKLRPDFIELFGCELLKKMGCDCNFELRSSWLQRIFRHEGKNRFHPLLHALIQLFLEEKTVDRAHAAAVGSDVVYQDGKWKCPNPYAEHDDLFRVPVVDRRWQRGGKITYLSARCSCGYGFSFRKGCAADPLVPYVTHVFAWGPHFEREAKRLKDNGLSISKIAVRMGVCRDVATRLIQQTRNRFERNTAEIPSLRRRWLKTRSKSLYRKLLRIDRPWLSAQEKCICRGGIGRSNDWSRMDKACAPLLRAAVARLKTKLPGRRLSFLLLEEESGIKSLKKKASRMPKCSEILSKAIERRGRRIEQKLFFGKIARPEARSGIPKTLHTG